MGGGGGEVGLGWVRVDRNREVRSEACVKIQKKKLGGGSGRGGGVSGWRGQSGCEWRRGEAFVKIQKKTFFFRGGVWSGGGGRVGGGQGGWEQRIEAFVKIQKKFFFFFWGGGRVWGGGGASGGVGLGVRVDVNGEVKFL